MFYKERSLIAHYISDETGELLFSEPYVEDRYRDDISDADIGLCSYRKGASFKTYDMFLLELVQAAFDPRKKSIVGETSINNVLT